MAHLLNEAKRKFFTDFVEDNCHCRVPAPRKVKVSYRRSVSMRNFPDLMKLGSHGGPG